MYALPAAGAFAAMHAIVPPHPGPVTAATELGASIGLTLLVGVVVAVVAWFVGVYVVTTAWLGKVHVPIDDSVLTGGRETRARQTRRPSPRARHPAAARCVLIGANTVLTTLRTNESIAAEGGLVDAVVFVGQTPVALLIALLVATYTLAVRRYPRGEIESLLNDSLGPICAIILITGAGGMFGGVLRYSGIGAALSDSLADLGLPLIVSAFVIATILRVAQGSATVALTTTAGLLSAAVVEADPSSLQLVALVLAIAAGATVLSHVNDSGFWLVGRFFGMDVKTTLRTWTVLETTLGRDDLRAGARCLGRGMTTPPPRLHGRVRLGEVDGRARRAGAARLGDGRGRRLPPAGERRQDGRGHAAHRRRPLGLAGVAGRLDRRARRARTSRRSSPAARCAVAYRDVLRRGGEGTFFVHCTGDKHMILDRMNAREHFMPPSLLESQLDTLEPLRPDERGMDVDLALPVDRIAAMVLARLDLS